MKNDIAFPTCPPKRLKYIQSKIGREGTQWQEVRREREVQGILAKFYCYILYCGHVWICINKSYQYIQL